jgi:hypothetical protein
MAEVHRCKSRRSSPRRGAPTTDASDELWARQRAGPTVGAPTTNTRWPALLDADLADPPEMHDRLVIATPRGHRAGGLETTRMYTIDIKGTRSRPGVMNPGRCRGGRSSDSDGPSLHMARVCTSLGRDNLPGCVTRLLRMKLREGRRHGRG